MRRGLWQLLVDSFVEVHGVLSFVVGVLIALVLYVVLPSDNVTVRLLVAVVVLLIVVLIVVVVTLLRALSKAGASTLPKVLAGGDPSAGMSAALVCWIEPSELFSYDIAVSFYSVSSQGFEALVGVGTVTIVQDDGTIQVAMEHIVDGHEDFAERLRRNEAEALGAARIKPNVPTGYISF